MSRSSSSTNIISNHQNVARLARGSTNQVANQSLSVSQVVNQSSSVAQSSTNQVANQSLSTGRVSIFRAANRSSSVARSSYFQITESNRTRVEGDITIAYHLSKPGSRSRTRRRNVAKTEADLSVMREKQDFLDMNRALYNKKKIYVIDTSSGPTEESDLGKLCYGHARCFGLDGQYYSERLSKRVGEPEQNFEWVLKLANYPVDLYMSNARMKDIGDRDGSEGRPYFSLFIGKGVYPLNR